MSKELVEAYDEYIKLLTSSEAALMPLAYTHGFRFPQAMVKRGEELRAKIADLKSKLDLNGEPSTPKEGP